MTGEFLRSAFITCGSSFQENGQMRIELRRSAQGGANDSNRRKASFQRAE